LLSFLGKLNFLPEKKPQKAANFGAVRKNCELKYFGFVFVSLNILALSNEHNHTTLH